jgi:hypothetical protein
MVLSSSLSNVLSFLQGLLSALSASHGCEPANSNLDSTTHKPPPIARWRKRAYLDFGILTNPNREIPKSRICLLSRTEEVVGVEKEMREFAFIKRDSTKRMLKKL